MCAELPGIIPGCVAPRIEKLLAQKHKRVVLGLLLVTERRRNSPGRGEWRVTDAATEVEANDANAFGTVACTNTPPQASMNHTHTPAYFWVFPPRTGWRILPVAPQLVVKLFRSITSLT